MKKFVIVTLILIVSLTLIPFTVLSSEKTSQPVAYNFEEYSIITILEEDILIRNQEEKLREAMEEARLEKIRLEEELKNKENLRVASFIKDYSIAEGKVSETDANQYAKSIMDKADRYEFDPLFITAVIKLESNFNKKSVGSSKDTGAMQIIPSTAKSVVQSLGLKYNYNDLFDIDHNIEVGTKYLYDTRTYYEGKNTYGYTLEEMALLGYNRGPQRALNEVSRGRAVTRYRDLVMKHYVNIQTEFKSYNN